MEKKTIIKKKPRWGTENVALLKDQCSIFIFFFWYDKHLLEQAEKKNSKNVIKRRDKQVVSLVSMKVLSHPGRCSSSRLSWGVFFFFFKLRCPKGFVSSGSHSWFLVPKPAEATNAKRTEENNVRKNIGQVHQKKYLYELQQRNLRSASAKWRKQFNNFCVWIWVN